MRLLHVTDALPHPAHACDPWYLERGKAVHLACHYADTCGLDWDSVDSRIVGYCRAWERCKAETGMVVSASEVGIGGERAGYVGTLDKIVILPDGNAKMGWPVKAGRSLEIWDLKCGGPEPWHGLQLAAYEIEVRKARKRTVPMARRTCHLSEDGTYRLIEHTGKDDFKTFLGYLTVAYWEINQGLREWPALREGEAA